MDAFLNALKAVSNTFSQHIVKLFHRANRAFISQPLLPTQGLRVDPGKKEDFGNSSSVRRGFQLVLKKDSVKPDPVLSQAPLSFPAPAPAHSLIHLPPGFHVKEKFRRNMWGDSVRFWHSLLNGVSKMLTG